MPGKKSLAVWLNSLPEPQRTKTRAGLTETEDRAEALLYDWSFWGRPNQIAPPGDWTTWLILAGRGFGKTRCGVEWLRSLVEGETPLAAPEGAPSRIALVAETADDARFVMIEGESGLLDCSSPAWRPIWEPSKRQLRWPNGVIGQTYAGVEPDQLRGPQQAAAWCDELAKWKYPQATWDNLQFGLRLGTRPRQVVTTTPKPIKKKCWWVLSSETGVTVLFPFENMAVGPNRKTGRNPGR